MIMQTRVLIICVTNAMFRASGARQERRRGAAVQVVDNVVSVGAQPARDSRADAVLPRSTVITLSTYGNPSSTGATQSSRRISIEACGRNRFSANSDGVDRTVSPIDRSRTTKHSLDVCQSQRAGRERLRRNFTAQSCALPDRAAGERIQLFHAGCSISLQVCSSSVPSSIVASSTSITGMSSRIG